MPGTEFTPWAQDSSGFPRSCMVMALPHRAPSTPRIDLKRGDMVHKFLSVRHFLLGAIYFPRIYCEINFFGKSHIEVAIFILR